LETLVQQSSGKVQYNGVMSAVTLLDVRNLNLTFKEKGKELSVLEDISFTLDEGEFLCLVGPSGSGKSTILRIISGILNEYTGEVLYKGEPNLNRTQT